MKTAKSKSKTKNKIVPLLDRPLSSFKFFNVIFGFFTASEKELSFSRLIRELVKRAFDFLRNVMIGGLILFLGLKTQNEILKWIGYGAILLLSTTVWSYFDPYVVRISFQLKNEGLGHFLNHLLRTIVSVIVGLPIAWVIFYVVSEVALSYLN